MADKKETKATKEPEFDVFDPANSLFCPMPTSPVRLFLQKAEKFNIKGRTDGPCTCLRKLHMPNGDRAIKGDTFDPVEERMNPAEYRDLLGRKFFTAGGEEVETKLLKVWNKK